MNQSCTADPAGARAHARAMAGTRAECMPVVPASEAIDRPEGVAAAAMLWDETIAPGGYAAKQLDRGARLRLIDVNGEACLSMLLFNAAQPMERLNVADTLKVQWNAYIGGGHLLPSDMGKVLMSVVDDSSVGHDAFCGASNSASNAAKYGDGDNWGPHPSARDGAVKGTGRRARALLAGADEPGQIKQSVPLFPLLAGGDPAGGHDVRLISAEPPQRRGSAVRTRHRPVP